jgi:hypothetical protein
VQFKVLRKNASKEPGPGLPGILLCPNVPTVVDS